MKGRDSGTPDEACWPSFFDPEDILDRPRFPAVIRRRECLP
jgi:hypothetical protein